MKTKNKRVFLWVTFPAGSSMQTFVVSIYSEEYLASELFLNAERTTSTRQARETEFTPQVKLLLGLFHHDKKRVPMIQKLLATNRT